MNEPSATVDDALVPKLGADWHRWPNRPVRFITDLRAFLTDDEIEMVINAIDNTCHHCWDDGPRCQCWNDD